MKGDKKIPGGRESSPGNVGLKDHALRHAPRSGGGKLRELLRVVLKRFQEVGETCLLLIDDRFRSLGDEALVAELCLALADFVLKTLDFLLESVALSCHIDLHDEHQAPVVND